MARFGAPFIALVCAGAAFGLLAIPVLAQEADEPPPAASTKTRARIPIRRVRGETTDRDAPGTADRENPEESGREAPAKRGEERIPRAPVQPLRFAPIDATMLKVLKDWEIGSAKIKELYGAIKRITYDFTYNTQKEAKGIFAYKAPDQGVFRLKDDEFKPGALGAKKMNSQTQQPVQLLRAADQQEHWICTGKELYKLDHAQKTYEVLVIPPQNRGQGIMDTPLPFLFGMKVQQARARYDMKFLKALEDTPGEVWLKVYPRWQSDAANYKEAHVVLDQQTFLPKAVRLIDPPGTTETVYLFSNLTQQPGFLQKDPFKERPGKDWRRVQPAQGKAEPQGARR